MGELGAWVASALGWDRELRAAPACSELAMSL